MSIQPEVKIGEVVELLKTWQLQSVSLYYGSVGRAPVGSRGNAPG